MPEVSDVFISYAPENRDAARAIASALERRDLDVAWDWDQLEGDAVAEETERELQAARCVLVLWSADSVAAGWVEPEAREGMRGDRLVLAALDETRLPRKLRRITPFDLSTWDGSRVAPVLDELVARVAATVAAVPEAPRSAEARDQPAAPLPGATRIDVEALLGGRRATLAGHDGDLYDIAWSRDGRRLGTASADGTAAIWDPRTGKRLTVLAGHDGEVNDVALGADFAVTGSDDGTVRWWSADGGRQQRSAALGGGAVFAVDLSPDGKHVAAVTADGVVAVFDGRGKARWRHDHEAGLAAAVFFPDGTVVAAGDDRGRLLLWDAGEGDRLLVVQAHDDEVTTLSVAPSGRTLASTSEHGGLAVWDLPEGTMRWWQSEPAGMVYGTAFSPGGDLLASCDDEGITLWRAGDGEPLAQIEDTDATRLEFAPAGAALAWAAGTVAHVVSAG